MLYQKFSCFFPSGKEKIFALLDSMDTLENGCHALLICSSGNYRPKERTWTSKYLGHDERETTKPIKPQIRIFKIEVVVLEEF